MSARLVWPSRRALLVPAVTAAALAVLLELSLASTAQTDYSVEAQPAFDALRHWHVGLFLDRSPSYGGSLILRAPLALLPNMWGGGTVGVFRAVSAPAVLTLCLFAVLLWGAAMARGANRSRAWIAMLLVVANPLAFVALRSGHSEEILVGAACVAAAIAAGRGRPGLAAALVGGAVAAKPWAIIAIGPLLLVLQEARIRFLAIAAAVAAAILAPFLVHGGPAVTTTATVAHSTGDIANPWQIWWFLGDHAGPVHRPFGHVYPDYRVEPGWVTRVSHPLVVAVPFLICAMRHRVLRERPWHDVLLLLAAVFFARCLLDTWNHHYYAFPAVLALGTWEVLARRRAPVAAWTLTALTVATVIVLHGTVNADVESAIYLAWALPFAAALTLFAFAPVWLTAVSRRATRSPSGSGESAESAPGDVADGLRANDPDEVLLAYR